MKLCKILFLILFLTLFFNGNIYSDKRKVIIFSLNSINWEDLKEANLKTFNFLFEKASLGIINTRSKNISLGSAYLPIGTSSRGIGIEETQFAFNYGEKYLDEKSQEVFLRRTGKNLKKENVFNPNIVKIIKENEISEYTIKVGVLGELLHKNNLKTSVFGNADTDEIHREIVSAFMDEKGTVDYGDISSGILIKDNSFPYGIKIDYKKMLLEFKKLKNKADLFAFELGDTYRLDEYREFLKDEIFIFRKKEILCEIDEFLNNILKEIDLSSTLLIILTPYPKKEERSENYFLAPVIIYSKEINSGILTSGTTRQNGIITNLDITPTILSFLKIKENDLFFGREIKSEKLVNPLQFIISLDKKLFNICGQNTPFLRGIIVYQSISIVIVLLFILLKLSKKFSIFLILSSASLPLSSLFLSVFTSDKIYFSLIYLVIIVLFLITLLKIIFKNNLLVFFLICILTFLVLLYDTIFGSYLMKYSPIGFSLSAGARYYGIGNEYLGILMVSLLLGITGIEEIYRKNIFNKISLPLFILSILIVGYPKLGANVGGVITVIFAFFITYYKIRNKIIDFRKIIYIILLIAFFLGMFIIVEISLNKEGQSHLGMAILQIKSEGIKIPLQIIFRKLQMNFKLIQYTFWNKILIASLIVITILYFYPSNFFKNLSSEFPFLSAGFLGVISGSIVGLIFNDSGIIISAVGFLGIAEALLILILERRKVR